ncbi:MAG: hypothetical protein ACRDPV_02810 [Gaiellaceae bacterium]
MARRTPSADDIRVRVWALLTVLIGAIAAAALVGASTSATAGRACGDATGNGGYAYAGHQATYRGHGVRATITPVRAPSVGAGHVAGWVGVGGPGQGANGQDAWIQAGIASMPGMDPFIYGEVTREGRDPEFILIEQGVPVGRSHRIAVLEMSGRAGWWRIWVDDQPATEPVRLRQSSGRWAPIATAESWNGGEAACNAFSFRFERVSVSYGGGGSWRPFVTGHQFLDGGYKLRDLASAPAETGAYRRSLASDSVMPYAFVAASS